jgi:hypothetical protein
VNLFWIEQGIAKQHRLPFMHRISIVNVFVGRMLYCHFKTKQKALKTHARAARAEGASLPIAHGRPHWADYVAR